MLIGADLIDRRIGDEAVSDIGLLASSDGRSTGWDIDKVRLAKRSSLGRRSSYRLADANAVPGLFDDPTAMEAEAARLRDFHPAEVAAVVRALPDAQRRQLADALDDQRLADVLEELPEEEQIRIVEGLDRERLEGIFDEMEFDDVADLLGKMTETQQEQMLDAMDDEDEEVVRRLLSYEEGTAGGLMTPEVIILDPAATVAEALSHVRDPDWVVSIAAQVFVCQAPFKTPTGRFLGVVHMQRLLREPPAMGTAPVARRRSHAVARDDRQRDRSRTRQLRPARRADLRRGRSPARSGHRRRRDRSDARRAVASTATPDRASEGHRRRGQLMKRQQDLSAPRARRRFGGVQVDTDAFGSFAESIASFIGTARFLVYQTVFITVWILHNVFAPDDLIFDPWSRGFTLLTLVLSIQAAYAAPLILLAQARQERRDRVIAEIDRDVAERTQDDTEFLAREIASVRVSLSDMVTGEAFDDRLERLTDVVETLGRQVDSLTERLTPGDRGPDDASSSAATDLTSSTVADAN